MVDAVLWHHFLEDKAQNKWFMKKIALVLALFVFAAGTAEAQAVKKAAKGVEKGVKKGAEEVKDAAVTVGQNTAEVATKGAAEVTDERVKGKVAPNGKTVYVDDGTKYYWVDEKGHKVYIKQSDLVDEKK